MTVYMLDLKAEGCREYCVHLDWKTTVLDSHIFQDCRYYTLNSKTDAIDNLQVAFDESMPDSVPSIVACSQNRLIRSWVAAYSMAESTMVIANEFPTKPHVEFVSPWVLHDSISSSEFPSSRSSSMPLTKTRRYNAPAKPPNGRYQPRVGVVAVEGVAIGPASQRIQVIQIEDSFEAPGVKTSALGLSSASKMHSTVQVRRCFATVAEPIHIDAVKHRTLVVPSFDRAPLHHGVV